MCGIIGAISEKNITNVLLKGLKRLEYRGYDSSGLVLLNNSGKLNYIRKVGKVNYLINEVNNFSLDGNIGLAHTRWATHGTPSEKNSHPHRSSNIFIVHNGIIENYEKIKKEMIKYGYKFCSDTDTEVIAHLLHYEKIKNKKTLFQVIKKIINKLLGNYSIVVLDINNPDCLISVNCGCPLIIGIGNNENFVASDQEALSFITNKFIYTEKGDIALIYKNKINIFDKNDNIIIRKKYKFNINNNIYDKDKYNYYMEKEIYQQPQIISKIIKKHLDKKNIFTILEKELIFFLKNKIKYIQIIGCGTSYNAGILAKFWFENICNIQCNVDIASEFIHKNTIVKKNSLLIALSQSGETADILSALVLSKKLKYSFSLAICNVFFSSLVRQSDFFIITDAGQEISVASTKSFTSQLIVLLILSLKINNLRNIKKYLNKNFIDELNLIPKYIKEILLLNNDIKFLANNFINIKNILILGRGNQYPIAMEGALKLKEIAYIHAEAYYSGELKHGALALIDKNFHVIMMVSKNNLLNKVKSDILEIISRNGNIIIFSDKKNVIIHDNIKNILLPNTHNFISPILYTIPFQMLSYNIGLLKKIDIDKPRNIAKSVTVE